MAEEAGGEAPAQHLDEYVRVRVARIVDPRTGREELVVTPLQRGAGAIVALRTVLCSTAFQCRLLECDGYSGRSAGRETWHGPADRRRPGHDRDLRRQGIFGHRTRGGNER
jgi:hypothetical protein